MYLGTQGWRNRGRREGSGRGGGRGGRGGRNGRGDRGRRPCRDYQQTGQCRFGDQCRFSHDLAGSDNEGLSRDASGRLEETPEQQRAKEDYSSWKRLIKQEPRSNDINTVRSLWTKALMILEGSERDWKHLLPRDLDDDEYYGREHIHSLLGMVAHAHGHAIFIELATPFLRVITHVAFLDCLSVDTFVGGLYNFISGSNGSRAIPFFQRLMAALVEYSLQANEPAESLLEKTAIPASIALRELLRREQRAMFHDDLPDLVASMENFAAVVGLDANDMTFLIMQNTMREVQGMVARARGLIQEDDKVQAGGVTATVTSSTYPRDAIIPGGHHDNDKADMTRIEVLPTEEEIRSDHPPFLPSTNFDQAHFLDGQIERHLDTQFRLLRHDVFGELSEALGGLLFALEDDPSLMDNPKFSFGNVRAYYYRKAHFRYVSFDQRRGLEAQISFQQPSKLSRETASSERRRWWEDSKRMDEGVLLCYLFLDDKKCSLLFLLVSEKITDPNKDHGLSKSKYEATITAKLASKNQRDLELLTRLSCHSASGLLVEFPGILLATFVPILENLQDMQRLGRLPFEQWVLPDRALQSENRPRLLPIPPPLYARRPGFEFSLKSILRDDAGEFSVKATTPVSSDAVINEIEARTGLDRGQCSALLAALTREFAFIQGPPGTGKSHLGVQLMRVLVSCKVKAELGPIFVMYVNTICCGFRLTISAVATQITL